MLAGAVIGLIFSLLHAIATVTLRADHIVSGTVMNLMAPALGVYLIKLMYGKGQTSMIAENFGYWNVPVLSKIPVIGTIFFTKTSSTAWVAIIIAFVASWVLFKTRFGLRLRSVGENPQAADTLGLNVYALRYTGVLISGVLGGIGGALFAQSIAGNFSASTIVGQGFMSMAAMIFGRWNPVGAMAAALFFGFSQSMAIVGAQLPVLNQVPSVYLQVAPYVFTVLILVVFLAKSKAPAADGVNYIKSV
ncbi:MAG TPA: sugar ABC transporter permease [Weissella confusa]|nr:sugar ABC transporter permease [Weissella confusa]